MLRDAEPVERVTESPPPLLAHLGRHVGDSVALCGARIMGIPAGREYPHLCVVCEALDPTRRA
jgi:hypothetical protein